MLKKKDLRILLSKLASHKKPKLRWEGYPLDSESVASIIFVAARVNEDIIGKKVVDLGCGSGSLAIGASLLGASSVVGIDIDKEAIKVAKENLQRMNVKVDFIIGDISCITGHFDTVLMNPPFGSWNKGSDIRFIAKALEISEIIYTLIKRSSSVREYMKQKITSIFIMTILITSGLSILFGNIEPVKADFGDVVLSFDSPGRLPSGLTWDGQYLWNVDADNSGRIYKIDPTTGNVLLNYKSPGPNTNCPPSGLAWDGSHLWCVDYDGSDSSPYPVIYKIDPGTGQAARPLA